MTFAIEYPNGHAWELEALASQAWAMEWLSEARATGQLVTSSRDLQGRIVTYIYARVDDAMQGHEERAYARLYATE